MIKDYMVIFGGIPGSSVDIYKGYGGAVTNNVYVWNAKTQYWIVPNIQGSIPSGQKFAPAVTAQADNTMLVQLTNATSAQGSLAKLDTSSWTWAITKSNPPFDPPALGIGMTFTAAQNLVYRFGGYNVVNQNLGSANNLLWKLEPNTVRWSQLQNGPTLTYHSSCYMSGYNILVFFGGQKADNDPVSDLNVFDLTNGVWNLNPSISGGPPPPRKGHSAVCQGNRMIMYGGGIDAPSDDAVWLLNATSSSNFIWSSVQTTNKIIGAVMGHSAVLYDNKMLIFGGIAIGQNKPNVHMLDINTWNWTVFTPEGNGNVSGSPGTTDKNGSNGGDDIGGSSGNSSSKKKTNVVIAIVAGVICGLFFLLIVIAAVIFIRRRCFDKKNGKFGAAFIGRRRTNTPRDVSYYSTDDPSIDIMTGRSSRDIRRNASISERQIPTPAAARVANKDIILNVASLPILFDGSNDKSHLPSRDRYHSGGNGTGTRLSHGSMLQKNIPEEEEAETWTFASSLGFDQQTNQTNRMTPPIRYMATPNPHQQPSYYNEDEDEDTGGFGVPLALPVAPPDVTAPRVPPVSVPGYSSMNSNSEGRSSSLPSPQTHNGNPTADAPSGGVIYDGLSPLDRIARLFSGGDVTGSIVRSEKEGGGEYHSQSRPQTSQHQYNQPQSQPSPTRSPENNTAHHQTDVAGGNAQEGRISGEDRIKANVDEVKDDVI
ncbi:10568_t:CDS:2 [Ambispora gerdemannii]|uniref:10568_t:CDS:1 n=1 Tax=Ambispora gerdemannii TaxID=144530 RepID=A0A9N8Z840_9GLOM|nr:10568_t:CDS:2 [Ambispora gerdemannii]